MEGAMEVQIWFSDAEVWELKNLMECICSPKVTYCDDLEEMAQEALEYTEKCAREALVLLILKQP